VLYGLWASGWLRLAVGQIDGSHPTPGSEFERVEHDPVIRQRKNGEPNEVRAFIPDQWVRKLVPVVAADGSIIEVEQVVRIPGGDNIPWPPKPQQ